MDKIKYVHVWVDGTHRHYGAKRGGAKGRSYHGTQARFEMGRSRTQRIDDMVTFITLDKIEQGGTYTDDRGNE